MGKIQVQRNTWAPRSSEKVQEILPNGSTNKIKFNHSFLMFIAKYIYYRIGLSSQVRKKKW